MDTEAPAPPRKGGADPEWRAQPNPVAKAAEGGSALDDERRHLGPKAADALDGATEARGHRRGRPATDARVTRVPEASPPNAHGAEQAPTRKAAPPKGRRGNLSIRSLSVSTDSGRAPGNRTRTAERSTPVLLERAGEIAVKQGDDRSERRGVNRVLLPQGRIEQSVGCLEGVGLQKSMGRIHRESFERPRGRSAPR